MNRRDFLMTSALAAATTAAAGRGMAKTPVSLDLSPLPADALAGHSRIASFAAQGKNWTVWDDLRAGDGAMTLVADDGALTLAKRTEPAYATADPPYLGLKLRDIAQADADLLAELATRLAGSAKPATDWVDAFDAAELLRSDEAAAIADVSSETIRRRCVEAADIGKPLGVHFAGVWLVSRERLLCDIERRRGRSERLAAETRADCSAGSEGGVWELLMQRSSAEVRGGYLLGALRAYCRGLWRKPQYAVRLRRPQRAAVVE